ncbi:hypothetical protein L9F63_007094, partial [Diploptera punctata]
TAGMEAATESKQAGLSFQLFELFNVVLKQKLIIPSAHKNDSTFFFLLIVSSILLESILCQSQ